MKLTKWMQGKKTYTVAILLVVAGILTDQGVVIPPYVWTALSALGLGAIRSGIKKAENG